MPTRTPLSTQPPKARATRASAPPKKHTELELRLAIGRDGLGIELAAAARMGPLEITELGMTLPAVKFPVDVSGGVQRFRHRRGVLERLTFELAADSLARDAAPKLRGLLGEKTPQLFVAVRPWGATIGIADDELGRALAFEVALDAYEDELRFTAFGARGIGLPSPAAALAARAVSGIFGKLARREGSRFVIEDVSAHVTRALLPDAGARAPDCRGARFSAITCASDAWILHVSRGVAAASPEEAVRAREAAALLRDADDARIDGDLERARALDLYCLERAPRHPEVCRRIADLDRLAGGRAEAARAILSDASDPVHSWALAGELAIEAADSSTAASALLRAADEEVVPALAALALERGASVAPDAIEALSWLDRAIARAPTSARLHWTRAAARIALGRMRDAIGDVEEVEAMSRGAGAKHAVWRRAATLWTTAGHAAEARALFERALRFMPDDAESLAGLGNAMIAQGKVARGVALLSRALQHAERSRQPVTGDTSPYALALARALAEQLGDRPAAIARVRTIGTSSREALVARGLEGRWRAVLGDKAGASLAYAQMRDIAASASELGPADDARAMLLEGATFERRARGDVAAAQAHLGVALRLFPRDASVSTAYREINDVLSSPQLPETRASPSVSPMAIADDDETRADELLRKYRGSPNDDRLVDELATILTRLGRSHEVLALLAGRYEDASPERRAQLAPAQIEVLARLERDARASGHDHEAQLFRDAIAAMGGAIEP